MTFEQFQYLLEVLKRLEYVVEIHQSRFTDPEWDLVKMEWDFSKSQKEIKWLKEFHKEKYIHIDKEEYISLAFRGIWILYAINWIAWKTIGKN